MAGNNMPVLSFDIVDEGKIQKLEELAEKIKNAFSVGPGGFRVTMPGVLPGNPIDHEANKSPAQNSRDHSAPENRSRDEKGRFLATGKANNKGVGMANPFTDADKFLKEMAKVASATSKSFGEANKTLQQTSKNLKSIFKTAVKWAAWLTLASGGGVFGYDMFARHVAQQYSTSQGLGMTTGQRQAAKNIYGTRFDNNDAIMEALAKAQKDGTSKEAAALYNIGLNPKDGVAANLPKVYEKTAQLIESNKGSGLSQAILDSQGFGALGVDLHTANQADANKDKLTGYGQQFKDTSQTLDISNKNQSSYQDATTTFLNNMDLVSNALTTKLASLNGPLGDLSTTIANGLKAFIDGPNGTAVFDMIRDGLTDLSNWLSGPNFKSDMHDFADDVKAVVSALGGFVRFAGDHPWLFGTGLLAMAGGGGLAASAAFASGRFATSALLRNPWTLGFVPTNNTPTTSEEMKGINNFDEKKWQEVADWQKKHPGEVWSGNSEVVQHAQAARGIRNNNPGNLKFAGQRGAMLENGSNASHAKFNTMEEGLHALERQLELYLGRGRNTIDSIFDIYSKKNHEAYKAHISNIMGIKPSSVITSENKAQMVKLMRGIISMENGSQSNQISDQQLATAWSSNHQKDTRVNLQVGLEQTPGSDVGLTVKSQGVRMPINTPMFVIPG